MPCRKHKSRHRVKVDLPGRGWGYPAAVARPVGKKELSESPAALQAMKKEWGRLRERKVWDESVIREWSEVAGEAQKMGKVVNFGYLFGICVEKRNFANKLSNLASLSHFFLLPHTVTLLLKSLSHKNLK